MKPFCKRCLLIDIDIDGLYREVADLISLIPEDKRADEELYAERLETCKGCDRLENGICGECGCFAELRAATEANYCPSYPKKW